MEMMVQPIYKYYIDVNFVRNISVPSIPDQVISLTVTNVTHNTVTLQWIPGFDGGLYSWFRVRYR